MQDLVSYYLDMHIEIQLNAPIIVDANITFPTGLEVQWTGSSFGNIAMPAIIVSANTGATFQVDAAVKVTDAGQLVEFTKALVSQDSVDWVISGSNLSGKINTMLRTSGAC